MSIVALTTMLMLAVTTVPGFLALAPEGKHLSDQWLVQRFEDQSEDVVRAIESALSIGPVSVDQFVEAFLRELGEMDEGAARDVLAQVLPRLSLERFLNGGWLELRLLLKIDRTQSARDLTRVIPKLGVIHRVLAIGVAASARGWIRTGSNLTRWQIRDVISTLPLGP